MAVILVVLGAASLQKNHRFHTGVMRCDNGAGEIRETIGVIGFHILWLCPI